MLLQMRPLFETRRAIRTFVRPEAQMTVIYVTPETVSEVEDLVTLRTSMRPSLLMSRLNMLFQIALFCETPVTDVAGEILDLQMNNLAVLSYSGGLSKKTTTFWARNARTLFPLPVRRIFLGRMRCRR